jgi:hypothetical protein
MEQVHVIRHKHANEAPPANTVAFVATLHRRRTAAAEPLAADLPP